jgi:hypothetical protein
MNGIDEIDLETMMVNAKWQGQERLGMWQSKYENMIVKCEDKNGSTGE